MSALLNDCGTGKDPEAKKLLPNHPLVSIITVVRNGEKSLEQAITSVLAQTYQKIEYIVIDGSSTDGTLDLIRKYADRIDHWQSGPDKGIYDAMNKGLDLASGEWIYFLGADDRLSCPETVAKIAPRLDRDLALVFGEVRYEEGRRSIYGLGWRTLLHNTVHHQSAFYNTRLFKDWRYDCDFKIVADYELNLMIYLSRQSYLRIPEPVAVCGGSGVSLAQWKNALAETNAIRRKHVGAAANRVLSALNGIEFVLESLIMPWRRIPS